MFPTVAGLKAAASVEVAGGQIGRVESIRLRDFEALITMRLDTSVRLQEDAIASSPTRGLTGDKVSRISAGGSSRLTRPGCLLRVGQTTC